MPPTRDSHTSLQQQEQCKIETLSSQMTYKFKEKKSVGEINNHLHAKVHDNVHNE